MAMFMIMTLDITRVQKVDKCPMIMTSQISCQGQGSSSVISVSSSLPLGTCPQSRVGTFRWMQALETRRALTILNKRDHGSDWRGRTRGIYWRTMTRHRTRASFSDLSKIQIQQTNVFESSEIKIKIQLKPMYLKAATENHLNMSTPPCLE